MSIRLLKLSLLSLVILAIGTTLIPNYPAFWLAAGTPMHQGIRAALSIILLLLIFTRPPRNVVLRGFAGLLAVAIGGWALQMTYINKMMLLDSLSMLAAAFSIAITALEMQSPRRYVAKKTTVA